MRILIGDIREDNIFGYREEHKSRQDVYMTTSTADCEQNTEQVVEKKTGKPEAGL